VGAARDRQVSFRIARPAAQLVLSTWPERAPAQDGTVGLRIRLFDAVGQYVPDSLDVRVTAMLGKRTLLDTTTTAQDGAAWAYVYVPASTIDTSSARGTRRTTDPTPDAIRIHARLVSAPVARDSLVVERGSHDWTGFVLSMPGGRPLARAAGTEDPEPDLAWINRDGFGVLSSRDTASTDSLALAVPALPGYRSWGDGSPPRFTPIAGGALHGRRIVIDPDGGGDNPGGMGTGGTRAAVLNLDVARALAAMLEAAGARVRLTRDADVSLSDLARVQISEAFRADRFLRIGHRPEPPQIGHYFSSEPGRAWGARVAQACSSLGLPVPARGDNAQYPLQQTSCPALYAGLARIDDPASESRLLEAGTVSRVAHALYIAFIREWAPEFTSTVDSLEIRDASGAPLGGAAVRIGNALHLESDPLGRVRFVRSEPGPLPVEVRDARIFIRRTLIDSERGTVLTGSRRL
jgi:N-acetylmuramoyl-L-alanine amidase